jgi:hypothetical protein
VTGASAPGVTHHLPAPRVVSLSVPSRDAFVLVVGNAVREIPWAVVDNMLSDRTHWCIQPGDLE